MNDHNRQGPDSPEGTPSLTVDGAARIVATEPDALLSDYILDYAAGLDEVSMERLRKRLSDAYVPTKDLQGFVRSVKARAKERKRATRTVPRVDRSTLPHVMITTDEGQANDDAIAALALLPGLYARMGTFVRAVETKRRRPGEAEAYTKAEVKAVTDPLLREYMSRSARWSEVKEDPHGGDTVAPAHPPDWSVKAVQARGYYPEQPPLYHLAESPTLLHDGRIIQEAGYDAASGVLCVSAIAVDVPEALTLDDAIAASQKLLRLVAQVPFENDAARSSFLAGLLTPVARWCFKGQTPVFMFDANKAGSGKGFLMSIISTIALGRPCDHTVQTADEEEERKFITSKVLTAQPIVFIDECDKPFGSGPLQGLITTGTWAPRLLGTNDSPAHDCYMVLYAAGNVVQYKSGDITRRICTIRIVTDLDNPAERTGFDIDDMPAYLEANRAELFEAALTMLRAWLQAGIKESDLPGWGGRWGSFNDWDRVVRGAIVWCGLADPIATKADAVSPMIKEGLPDLVAGLEEALLTVNAAGEASIAEVHALLEANDSLRKDARGYGAGVTPPSVNFVALRRAVNSMMPRLNGHTPSGQQLATLIGKNKLQPVAIGSVRKWIQNKHGDAGNTWRVDVIAEKAAPSALAEDAAYEATERAGMMH